MKRLGLVLAAVALSGAVGVFALHSARADTTQLPTRGSVEARIAALEQKVTTLETQNAALRRVIDIDSNGANVTIHPTANLTLSAPGVTVSGDANVAIRAAIVDIKGAGFVNIN